MMNPITIQALASGFTATGMALGIPSFAVLLLWTVQAIRPRLADDAASSTHFGDKPDAILLTLKGITETIGALGRIAGSLGQFVLNGLAIVAVVGLVMDVACWFTGLSLNANANWARISVFGLQLDEQGRFKPELSYAYTFNLQEMKSPLVEAVTRAGWDWRPTTWQGPTWLRWLTE